VAPGWELYCDFVPYGFAPDELYQLPVEEVPVCPLSMMTSAWAETAADRKRIRNNAKIFFIFSHLKVERASRASFRPFVLSLECHMIVGKLSMST
jgi:hypothetical protein